MEKTVKHRYHPLLLQYHSTNTKSTLQKRLSHSMDNSTERRICDQQVMIMKKANNQENVRGSLIARLEIYQLRKNVSREIENKRNPQQNESNNTDVVIEGEDLDLPPNIIPPEENGIK